jgi:hypothetical protein
MNDDVERQELDFEGLSSASYLVDVYVTASDLYREFEATDRPSKLLRAAAVLCMGLTQLDADEEGVWEAMRRLPRVREADRQQVWAAIDDIEALVGLEVRILKTFSRTGDVGDYDGLLKAAGKAVLKHRAWPDEDGVSYIRRAVTQARVTACRDASLRDETKARGRSLSINRGLKVAGGVGVIGANAAAAFAGGVSWYDAGGSVLSGVEITMSTQQG